jgi:hypothetical protein
MAICNPLTSNDLRVANSRVSSVYFRWKYSKCVSEKICAKSASPLRLSTSSR